MPTGIVYGRHGKLTSSKFSICISVNQRNRNNSPIINNYSTSMEPRRLRFVFLLNHTTINRLNEWRLGNQVPLLDTSAELENFYNSRNEYSGRIGFTLTILRYFYNNFVPFGRIWAQDSDIFVDGKTIHKRKMDIEHPFLSGIKSYALLGKPCPIHLPKAKINTSTADWI